MCPIETPEGPNIGLISSLSTYAKVNEFGFLETPYFRVQNGVVDRKKPEFLAADIEDRSHIAPANTPFDKRSGELEEGTLTVRFRGEYPIIEKDRVDFMDVSPIQLVSPAAALIPFLEHDDANRALMGSNMQRQAVPLLVTEAPLVGTGLEDKVAEDSGALVLARRSGAVEFVSGEMIAIRYERDVEEALVDYSDQPNLDIYRLVKFRRSNQDTCLNQRPVVIEGQKVKKGQVIADGPATREGELALGRNVLVAFMPWGGYNFEDAILVRVRAPGARHQARRRGDHSRDSERLRGGGQEPRRGRRHPDRRAGPPGRHPGRQGDAQGRTGALTGGTVAQGHLRRQGRRRA
jgi:DNA-directed RNA polymerase subunit beta